MKNLFITCAIAATAVAVPALASAQTYRGPTSADDPLYQEIKRPSALERYRPNYDPHAHEWQSSQPGSSDESRFVRDDSERNCSPLTARASKKPLTPKQIREYKELRSAGITKKDAARVVRDPGVKKGEWGWTRVGGASEGVMCVKYRGGPEFLMKYRNNVVIE